VSGSISAPRTSMIFTSAPDPTAYITCTEHSSSHDAFAVTCPFRIRSCT
jgi:hypothetical protein